MVDSPCFERQPDVIDSFSDLVARAFGGQVGAHARGAVGMAELPMNIPVAIEAELPDSG